MFASPHFQPVPLGGRNLSPDELPDSGCADAACNHADTLPLGQQILWGMPFDCGDGFVYAREGVHSLDFAPFTARYLVFLHACESNSPQPGDDGIYRHMPGIPPLMQPICDYVIRYADGQTLTVPMRARMEINDMDIYWGEGSLLSKSYQRGKSFLTNTDEMIHGTKPEFTWGQSQFRVVVEDDMGPVQQWLYAFDNPRPDVEVVGMDIVRREGNVFVFGLTAGNVSEHPLRYGRRQKALLTLNGQVDNPFDVVDIDLGHIISVLPRLCYDNPAWERTPADTKPARAEGQYIVEYDAHPEAILYLGQERKPLRVSELENAPELFIRPAEKPVSLRVCDEAGNPVPVKVHAHGAAGEYLPPRNRHRIPNPYWFEDYGAEHVHGEHWAAYIDGTAQYLLPLGEVFFEVSKGFEIKPVRQHFVIAPDTDTVTITLERTLNWRARGWVTADTHVHFLSPQTALLEGEAEGVNVVNLLASQWGELFTNVGDFTGEGETARGEHIVRVGTENRQHIMGHISLLGYQGAMILPLTTGGPDESAQGDPMEITLTQWAAQCRAQGGLSILPHFPHPRAENAAAIVSGLIDGVETVNTWGVGINPYYISDWYRYLSCGYHVAAVGGTDKMSARTAIGEMRTYALLDGPLSYEAWKQAILSGRTFATCGPLIDMRVEDQPLGGTVKLNSPARLTIPWSVASVTVPVTSVELVMNGETVDGVRFDGLLGNHSGVFTVNVERSVWLALRVRGRFGDNAEHITAHTSAVFVYVRDEPILSGPDAASILDQIEGATAYVKTLATRAQEAQYKLALSALLGAHRQLHNRMHAAGMFHHHSPEDRHPGH